MRIAVILTVSADAPMARPTEDPEMMSAAFNAEPCRSGSVATSAIEACPRRRQDFQPRAFGRLSSLMPMMNRTEAARKARATGVLIAFSCGTSAASGR